MNPNPDFKKFQTEWRPNKKQEQFLSLPITIPEAAYLGGAGSGKSDVLLVYAIVHGWYTNPRFKQVFLRRTFPELKNEILGRSREIYARFGATLNKTDMIWTFPREDQYGSGGLMGNSGAQIFLSHCEHDDDVRRFDSMEICLFTPDEITSLTQWIYLYISQERTRAPKDTGLPSITRGAGMPGGIGHAFVKKRFIDPYPAGGKIIVGRGGNKRIFIHATYVDNIDHVDPTYGQKLDGRPEAERRAKKFGDFDAYLGQVFDEFRDKKYRDEPENALHVVQPFEIPSWWPRMVIGDWGFAAMCWIGFFAISPTKRLYLYREMHWTKTKISVWAPEIKKLIDKEHPRVIKFCRSAGQERGQEHTIQEQISSELGVSVELSNNNSGSRVAGKMLLHEYLRWKVKPVIPPNEIEPYSEIKAMWIYRNRGVLEYKSYLELYSAPVEETNIPKLQIFLCDAESHEGHADCCPVVIDSIKACNYDKPKNGKVVEDVKEFDGDDPYDGIRYAIDAAEEFFDEAAEEFLKVQKQEELSQRLNQTGDMTAFYRNSFALDSVNKIDPVRLIHKGR